MNRLRERLERGLAPGQLDRPPDVAGVLGFPRQRLERSDGALAMRVARLEHPLVVEPGEQRALAERERLLAATLGAEPFRLEHVHPGAVGEPDAVAGRHERVGAERSPERPERAAQARAGALVEHVGPEARRDCCPRVATRVEREPAQQGARPPGRKLPSDAVDLDGDLSHEPDPHHRQSLQRDV